VVPIWQNLPSDTLSEADQEGMSLSLNLCTKYATSSSSIPSLIVTDIRADTSHARQHRTPLKREARLRSLGGYTTTRVIQGVRWLDSSH